MSELTLIIINIFLLGFPIIYLLSYGFIRIREKKAIYSALLMYLVFISVIYIIEIISELIFDFYESNLILYIELFFLTTSLLCLIGLGLDISDVNIRHISLGIIIYLIISLIFIFKIFFAPMEVKISHVKPLSATTSLAVLLIMVSALAIPLTALIIISHIIKKQEIETKDLKFFLYYLAIIVIIFFSLGLISYIVRFKGILFSGDLIEFEDTGEIVTNVMNSIIYDDFFMIMVVFTMLAGWVTVLPNPIVRMTGNLIMAFLPMILWMTYFFGEVPDPILDLFFDWEWFAKIFYILITTMLIVMILSAFKLFSGIVVMM